MFAGDGASRDGGDPPGGGDAPGDDGGERACSRRAVLLAAAGTAAFAAPETGRTAASGTDEATLRAFVYPGPTPLYARLLAADAAIASGWTAVHRDAAAAVEDAFAQVAAHAARTGRGRIDYAVERCDPIGDRFGVASPLDALAPASRVFERFRDAVTDRRPDAGACCHLLLWWGPLDYEIGYGRTLPGTPDAARSGAAGALSVANVGATEVWDDRAVTRNLAIHETLHAFLSAASVSAVVDSRCDHDLGRAAATAPGVREVSPMATAYAGPARVGGGTRWHGRGCYDHDAFSRHDGTEGVDEWRHTQTLSDATLEAVARYAERHLR